MPSIPKQLESSSPSLTLMNVDLLHSKTTYSSTCVTKTIILRDLNQMTTHL